MGNYFLPMEAKTSKQQAIPQDSAARKLAIYQPETFQYRRIIL